MLPSFIFLLSLVPATLSAPLAVLPSTADIVQGKYIVTLNPGYGAENVDKHLKWVNHVHARSIARRSGSEKGVDKVWKATDAFKGYSGEFDKDTIKQINSKDEVLAVEPVRKMALFKTVTQTNAPNWGLGAISHKNPGSTNYVYDDTAGQGMWAYVVDTGVYTGHSEFEGRAYWGYNAYPNSKNTDINGHGTHCAGVIASKTYGVAKKANIMAVKVLDGASSTTDIVLDGFQWAVRNITKTPGRAARSVISLSLGGTKSSAFNAAINAAYSSGILVVAAAGNNNAAASLYSPGSAAFALTVGAVDNTNTRASFSNYGSLVDLFAPGVAITSLGISSKTATATMTGTSMACPHVAGLSIYLKAKEANVNTLATPAAITARVKSIAVMNKVTAAGTGTPNVLAYNGAA